MTDKEVLCNILKKAHVRYYEENPDTSKPYNMVTIYNNESSSIDWNNGGYFGFYCTLYFNEDNSLHHIASWE